MAKVSIIVPAGKEPYLQQTISDIVAKAAGDIEVIVILDGWWPDPGLKDDPRVKIIHRGSVKGMRHGINSGARIATGKYLLKCDAHCAFDSGFDVKLVKDCRPDWVIVPVRYRLDVNTWQPKKRRAYEFQYIEKDTLKGRDWPEYGQRYPADEKLIDLMTTQGSCWFMHKDYFFTLGGIDDVNHGHMGREAQEVCLKTWLSGGRFVLSRNTWYAHWAKPKEFVLLKPKEKKKSVAHAIDFWNNNKWDLAKHDLAWLAEKFAPVPGWDNKKARGKSMNNGVVKMEGMNRAAMYKHFASLGVKVGAEIGVQRGRNAKAMQDHIPGVRLYLIDPYRDYEGSNRSYGPRHHKKVRGMTHKRMRGKDVIFLEMFSAEAASKIPDRSLDFVYIDGMHLYNHVMMDIILYSRKVKEGGVVAGHDYDKNRNVVGVYKAVNDYVRAHGIKPLYVTDRAAAEAKGDKTTSWFFINPPEAQITGRVKHVGRY